MFKLSIFLDSIRKNNNYIDSTKLIKIVRLGEDHTLKDRLTTVEMNVYTKLKDICNIDAWTKIDDILEKYNTNWDNRKYIQQQIEQYLSDGNYKEADIYYLEHLGGLKYATQYKPMKDRFFSKCNFCDALKDLDFEKANHLFKDQCNDDMLDLFRKKLKDSTSSIDNIIDKLIESNDWVQASQTFNKFKDYLEYKTFKDYIQRYKCRLDELINKAIEKMIISENYLSIEQAFSFLYPNIPLKYIEHRYLENMIDMLQSKILSDNIEDTIIAHKKFERYLSNKEYELLLTQSTQSLLLHCPKTIELLFKIIKIYVVFLKAICSNIETFWGNFTSIVSYDYSNELVSINNYNDLLEYYLSYLLKNEYLIHAKLVYQTNADFISIDKFNQIHKAVLSEKITIYESSLPESMPKIQKLFDTYKDILDISVINHSKEKYRVKNEEIKIHRKINELFFKLEMLSEAFIGVTEQEKVKNQLFDKLRDIYKLSKNCFSEEDISKINYMKKLFNSKKNKDLFPNIDLSMPTNIKDAVFFHKKHYYIASFVDFNYSYSNQNYIVKPYKGKNESVDKHDLIIIGTLIRNNFYHSHCYSCRAPIDGGIQLRCSECNWYICSDCGACGCGYSNL